MSCPLGTQAPELEDSYGKQNEAPIIQVEIQVDTQIQGVGRGRPMGIEGAGKRNTFNHLPVWATGNVTADCRPPSMVSIYKKIWKEDLGHCIPVSLLLVLGKFMEQIILSAATWHEQNKQGVSPANMGLRQTAQPA